LNAVGAIASNKSDFNYLLLTPFSIGIYIFIGYLLSWENSLGKILFCNALIGIYDGSIGWDLSTTLKAKTGLKQGPEKQRRLQQRIVIMVVFAGVFGCIGCLIAKYGTTNQYW